jgi:hypothetical protein
MAVKLIIPILIIIGSMTLPFNKAENFDFDASWKKVDSLSNEGLNNEINELVTKILLTAKVENNAPELFHALRYKSFNLDEEIDSSLIEIDKAIGLIDFGQKEPLYALKAFLYEAYVNAHNYELSNRTSVVDGETNQVKSLSRNTLDELILKNYGLALAKSSLVDLPSSLYKRSLILTDSIFQDVDLTMFDLVALHYASYLANDNSPLAVDDTELTIQQAIGERAVFLSTKIGKSDSKAAKAAIVFQKILKQKRSSSILNYYLDLKRLQYFRDKYSGEESQSLYKQALTSIEKGNMSNEVGMLASIELINLSINNGEPLKESHQKAISLLKKFPDSKYIDVVKAIVKNIELPVIQLEVEGVYTKGEKLKMKVTSTNVDKADIRIFKIEKKKDFLLVGIKNVEDIKTLINGRLPVFKDLIELQNIDFTKSEQEFDLNAKLGYGLYACELSQWNAEMSGKFYAIFQVSDLGFYKLGVSEGSGIYVSNRKDGKPLKDVAVTGYRCNYRSWDLPAECNSVFTGKTDGKGFINPNNQDAMNLKLSLKADEYISSNAIYLYDYNQNNDLNQGFSHTIFTDRSIYRPGQKVYYKLLATSGSGNNKSIAANHLTSVKFYDANNQLVSEIKSTTTNAFGTLSGSFEIPKGRLNGNYRIQTNHGGQSILVEEYKRPSFEILEHSKVIAARRDQLSTIQVKAIGLAGNGISNAMVKYVVSRQTRQPRCYFWDRSIGETVVLSSGETTTDIAGIAGVSFIDKSKLYGSANNKLLQYTIDFTITDQAGETQEFSKTISFADQDFFLVIEGEDYNKKDSKPITVKAFDANNDKKTATGTLIVYSAISKDKVTRINYWQEDYAPYKQYSNDTIDLKKYEMVKKMTFETDKPFLVDLEGGDYILEALAIDSKGKNVRITKTLAITDFKKDNYPASKLVHVIHPKLIYQPNETIEFDFGSNVTANVRVILLRGSTVLLNDMLKVGRRNCIKYKVKETDRGGLTLKYIGFYENRYYGEIIQIDVPWDNKKLDIKFENFRDKTRPGSEETITMMIQNKGNGSATEVAATLYDASLDMIQPHQWDYGFYNTNYSYLEITVDGFGLGSVYMEPTDVSGSTYIPTPQFPTLFENVNRDILAYRTRSVNMLEESMSVNNVGAPPTAKSATQGKVESKDVDAQASEVNEVSIRENLQELVFFYPQMNTDSEGKLSYTFKINDALTRWKLITFAHDKELRTGMDVRTIVTQKELMIKSNKPRILRHNDEVFLTANVSNLTAKPIDAECKIALNDFIGGASLQWCKDLIVKVSLKPGETKAVAWKIAVPSSTNVNFLQYVVSVESNSFKDAELDKIPVVTDKILVTEATPMTIRGLQKKSFPFPVFDGKSATFESSTLELITNPMWSAFTSLPSITMDNPRSAGQLMNNIYSDAIGQKIISNYPAFKISLQAKVDSKEPFLSRLQENEELKNVLLQATPYVNAALSEATNYANLSKFLNTNNVSNQIQKASDELKVKQRPDGGFSYYNYPYPDVYTTVDILTSIGRLKKLGISNKILDVIATKASDFLTNELVIRYDRLVKDKGLANYLVGDNETMILYGLYLNRTLDAALKNEKIKFFFDKNIDNWGKQSIAIMPIIGQLALGYSNKEIASKIYKYFQENAKKSDDLGMFWQKRSGFNFTEFPISLHASVIEYYQAMGASSKEINEIKIWLLNNKRVNSWYSNRATADVVYALVSTGETKEGQLSGVTPTVTIGDKSVDLSKSANLVGYFKKNLSLEEVNSGKQITVVSNQENVLFGGIFTQYYQKADLVRSVIDNPLKISKEFYKESTGARGKELTLLKMNDKINVGDVIVARMIIKVDRAMSYLILTDARPSGFEPVKGKEGFYFYYNGYTTDITDYQANYFFYSLEKGTKVIENRIIAVHRGNFSGGIATIQSNYSPEFVSHTEGLRLEVF